MTVGFKDYRTSETVYPLKVLDLQEAPETVEAMGPQIVHESIRLTVSIEVHGFTVNEELMDRLLLTAENPAREEIEPG